MRFPVSVEIFAHVCFIVELLSDSDKHGAVALLGFLGDLIPGTTSVHRHLVMSHFLAVDSELLLTGKAAILLLRKYQRLQDAGGLYSLHFFHLLRLSPKWVGSPFFREMISEQAVCECRPSADSHAPDALP